MTALCAGAWARLAAFGERGLTIDEAFSFRAAESILKNGLPSLLDGGLYVQGLIPHYLIALSMALFGANETALRLPALLAGLALPVFAFQYARRYVAPLPAAVVSAAVLLSSWQIEFSRFGRMYTLFACVTLLFLMSLDRSVAGGEWKRRYRAHAWAGAAVLCHVEGALLAPLLFVPLLDLERFPTRTDWLRYACVTGLTVAAILAFALFDFRRWGVPEPFPPGYVPPSDGPLRFPQELLWAPGLAPPETLAAAVAALALMAAWAAAGLRRGRLQEGGALAVLACGSALLHQLALTAVLTVVLVARSRRAPARPRLAVGLGWIAAATAVWPMLASLTGSWRNVEGAGSALGAARLLFFGWPDFYDSLWRPWGEGLPILGAAVAVATVVALVLEGGRPWTRLLASPAGVTAYFAVCFGLVRYFYEEVRYHYFLYPVLLVVVVFVLTRLADRRWGAAGFAILFAISGDFDPLHIRDAGADMVAMRAGRYEPRVGVWYPRPDFRGAAAELERLRGQDASIRIVAGSCPPLPIYFSGELTRYLDRSEHPFHEQARRRGTVEMWEGGKLLSTAEELRDWSAEERELLLVRRLPGDLPELDPETVWGDRLLGIQQEFSDLSGGVDIVRVTLAAQPAVPKQ